MSQKEPNYKDKKGRIVHEIWTDGKLVSMDISDFGDENDHGYYEQIQYDDFGNKSFRKLREPIRGGYHKLEEHYDKGYLTSQTEEMDGNPNILKFRHFYPQITPDGTRLDKEILRRETIINHTTGEIQDKEFDLTGAEMVPQKKKTPLLSRWVGKNR